ncbi:28S ribosomal protein S18c, mitochondrial isoform X2 [Girardinichthys multiradiatus]|uniref:28S ribosomal protein S18c, mitochondrial isoform X2 n=1 Tax=Girardinichthys multiradiatus TaxID=208333 RepID=UPI001FAD8116|nr:28S ribosomal protein S18c, mitochondrial isoform X2 [Girardinichthys multiradiatus]
MWSLPELIPAWLQQPASLTPPSYPGNSDFCTEKDQSELLPVVPQLLPVPCQVIMLCVRGLQRLKAALYLHRNAAYRSLTSAEVLQKEDPILNAERSTKESQKGCVLCSITVDFKNIQLLSQFISPHTGRIYGRHITGFMSVTHKHPQFMKDPRICGIKHLD